MRKQFFAAGCLLLLFRPAAPCEYNIRDAGFVDLLAQRFRLYVFIDDRTSEESTAQFLMLCRRLLLDSNIETEIVDIGKSPEHRAMEYYRFWEIESPPAAILVSPDQRSLQLSSEGEEKDFPEILRQQVEKAVSSPLRDEILSRIVTSYAMILLIESSNPSENQAAAAKINEAAAKITPLMRQLPKRIDEAPQILRIPPEQFQKEKILFWSLDMTAAAAQKPRIVVLFGRGRILYRPFAADEITAADLFNMLSVLGFSCDCGLNKRGMLGLSIPLRWDEDMQSQVVKYLGFDAENPLIKREISGALATERAVPTSADSASDSSRILDQYRESAIAFEEKFGSSRISPALAQELNSSGSRTAGSGFDLTFALILGGGIIFLMLAAAFYLRHRAGRKET